MELRRDGQYRLEVERPSQFVAEKQSPLHGREHPNRAENIGRPSPQRRYANDRTSNAPTPEEIDLARRRRRRIAHLRKLEKAAKRFSRQSRASNGETIPPGRLSERVTERTPAYSAEDFDDREVERAQTARMPPRGGVSRSSPSTPSVARPAFIWSEGNSVAEQSHSERRIRHERSLSRDRGPRDNGLPEGAEGTRGLRYYDRRLLRPVGIGSVSSLPLPFSRREEVWFSGTGKRRTRDEGHDAVTERVVRARVSTNDGGQSWRRPAGGAPSERADGTLREASLDKWWSTTERARSPGNGWDHVESPRSRVRQQLSPPSAVSPRLSVPKEEVDELLWETAVLEKAKRRVLITLRETVRAPKGKEWWKRKEREIALQVEREKDKILARERATGGEGQEASGPNSWRRGDPADPLYNVISGFTNRELHPDSEDEDSFQSLQVVNTLDDVAYGKKNIFSVDMRTILKESAIYCGWNAEGGSLQQRGRRDYSVTWRCLDSELLELRNTAEKAVLFTGTTRVLKEALRTGIISFSFDVFNLAK